MNEKIASVEVGPAKESYEAHFELSVNAAPGDITDKTSLPDVIFDAIKRAYDAAANPGDGVLRIKGSKRVNC